MDREIKFRAWRSETGNMTNGLTLPMLMKEEPYKLAERSDKYNFMQYTGLKDKNGVEIYEGDIIQYNFKTKFSNDEFTSPVVFDEFMWITDEHSLNRLNNIEVIGNIHQNPELL